MPPALLSPPADLRRRRLRLVPTAGVGDDDPLPILLLELPRSPCRHLHRVRRRPNHIQLRSQAQLAPPPPRRRLPPPPPHLAPTLRGRIWLLGWQRRLATASPWLMVRQLRTRFGKGTARSNPWLLDLAGSCQIPSPRSPSTLPPTLGSRYGRLLLPPRCPITRTACLSSLLFLDPAVLPWPPPFLAPHLPRHPLPTSPPTA